jgi:general secretion pathway protein I
VNAPHRKRSGFTLLEVMVAVAILAVGLSAVFSAEAGAVRMAQRAHKLSLASLLVRCKMGEIEEDVAKKGLPAIYASGSDKCCKDAEIEGFKCKWEILPIVLPDTMFGEDDDKKKDKKSGTSGGSSPLAGGGLGSPGGLGSAKGSGSGISAMVGAAAAALGFKPDSDKEKDLKDLTKDPKKDEDKNKILKEDPKDVLAGDPSRFLAGGGGKEVDGITAMAMQFVYPVLKPAFQSQIRRATVSIHWEEGNAEKTFDVTQYLVAEQPVPLTMDPNNPNQVLGSGTGTGTGTGSTMGTGSVGSGSSIFGLTR